MTVELAAAPAVPAGSPSSVLLGLFLMALSIVIYLVPAIVALRRHARSRWLIVALDLLAGWTVIGWLVALIWAFRDRRGPGALPEPTAATPRDNSHMTQALVPVVAPGALQKPGETFYWFVPKADVLSEKQTTDYVARTSGSSIEWTRSWTQNWSNLRLQAVQRSAVDVDDTGMLVLSNRRALFLGNRMTIDIPFSDIAGVATFTDGLRINRASAAPVIFQTGSYREAGVLQRLVNGDTAAHLTVVSPVPVKPPAG